MSQSPSANARLGEDKFHLRPLDSGHIPVHWPMTNDGMTWCCLCCKDILHQSDRLVVDQIAQHWVIESFMDVLDQMVNLARTKLEYTSVWGVPGINPANRDNPTTWECRNTLVGSALPSCAMTSLTTRPSQEWTLGWWILSRWINILSTIHGSHLLCVSRVHRWANMVILWTMKLSCAHPLRRSWKGLH